MEHEQAAGLLAELAAGQLDPATTSATKAHVAACEECRGVLAVAEAVRTEAREHGQALFEGHAEPELLARFALEPGSLERPALAAVAAHVRACPGCAAEVRQARDAAASAWTRALPARLAGLRGPVPWLTPALGALALVLMWPAYQGFVELPRLRAHLAAESGLRAERDAQRSRERGREPQALPEGALRSLVLSEASRASGSERTVLTPRAGQAVFPVLVDLDLGRTPPAQPLRVEIVGADGAAVWTLDSSAGAIWDATSRVVGLLVPAAKLPPGDYELHVSRPREPAFFRAPFRVVSAH